MIRSRLPTPAARPLANWLRGFALVAAATGLTCTSKSPLAVPILATAPTQPPATLTAAAATDTLSAIASALQVSGVVNLGEALGPHVSEIPDPCRGSGEVTLVDLADTQDEAGSRIGPALVVFLTPADYDPCTDQGFPVLCSVAMVEVAGMFRLAAAEIEHGGADRLDVDAGVFAHGQGADGDPCQFLALEFGSEPQCREGATDYVEERQIQIFSYQNGYFEAEQTLLEHAIEHGAMSYQATLDWVDVGDQPVLVRHATRTTLEIGGDEGASSGGQPFEKTVVELDFFTIDDDCHLIAADEEVLREADTDGVLPPAQGADEGEGNGGDEIGGDEIGGDEGSDEGSDEGDDGVDESD